MRKYQDDFDRHMPHKVFRKAHSLSKSILNLTQPLLNSMNLPNHQPNRPSFNKSWSVSFSENDR